MWLTSKPRSGKLQTRARLILVEEGPEDRTIRAEKLPRGLGSRVGQLNCKFSMKIIGLFHLVNCLVWVS